MIIKQHPLSTEKRSRLKTAAGEKEERISRREAVTQGRDFWDLENQKMRR
jgi:hypothetical protein